MLYHHVLFLAQIQAANIIAGLAVMIALFGSIISFGSLKLMRTKMIQENKDKMASKIFVREEVTKIEIQTLSVGKQLDDHKHNNEREHDNIRKEVSEKLDLIIELVKSKSA